MSCSDASSAQNVANKLGGNARITAWDGKVTVFENGTVSGEGVCRQFTPGNNSRILTDAETPKGTNAGKNGIGITLGVNTEWNSLFKVDNALKSADEIAGVLVNGSYLKNPTAKSVVDLFKNPSGAMKLDQSAGSILNGQYMYVIDDVDNIIIGTRANGISPFNGKAPHPTLIGGVDPSEKTAGIIEFRGGKIYKVDNVSGHFKPSSQSLQNAQSIFNQKFAPNNFTDDFQGFVPFTN